MGSTTYRCAEEPLIVTKLDQFSGKIIENLDQLNWHEKRDIMRHLVKRIELGNDDINIVYRVNKLLVDAGDTSAQHCCNGMHGSARG